MRVAIFRCDYTVANYIASQLVMAHKLFLHTPIPDGTHDISVLPDDKISVEWYLSIHSCAADVRFEDIAFINSNETHQLGVGETITNVINAIEAGVVLCLQQGELYNGQRIHVDWIAEWFDKETLVGSIYSEAVIDSVLHGLSMKGWYQDKTHKVNIKQVRFHTYEVSW